MPAKEVEIEFADRKRSVPAEVRAALISLKEGSALCGCGRAAAIARRREHRQTVLLRPVCAAASDAPDRISEHRASF